MQQIVLPKIIAHRGASANAPENTHSALRLAAEYGARWVEIDVMLAACHTPIIFHDDTLERCSNGTGRLIDQPYTVLRQLDAGAWFAPQFAGEQIATLTNTVELLIQLNMGLNLEIKPLQGLEQVTAQAVVTALQQIDIHRLPLLISSFSPRCLAIARDQLPNIPRGFLTEKIPPHWQSLLQELRCISLHCDYTTLTASQVQAVKTAGYQVLTFTVNQPQQARQLFAWGVDAVFSDYPQLLINELL
ncbi:glycerophosphoryl diester phosphodiesterase [Beggiatoa leptomitoformis]|uniref:Glycerophosphoryl diester phosphodiesterase n=1 Tax=Beggiatoa leptomitoformis TaxID=288004 RepID=A0A2N9YBB1_9GAMM|nr:glycerophosphoryl diester phosphodiesterase [Beggiatoa leptomitoformis]ALG66882.1 glycerophosphoryl diester phosphodiesterase [Beggiatoa leptomitoformis]AUI67760.1 glycerophosphoryl diester phosphodiesterase [Beggiatoa leptomitoformis]